ncbi:MAG: hypothetical protein BWY93_02179 [Euryarchaeota archaeon ADurb.BinA087]|nr:MAG: hypothetical protein BWY93_02179 [Euryarchaeota archaeon ADurb.BinA087]
MFRDLAERCTVLADDDTRFLSLDEHLTGIRIKEDIGDPCIFCNHLTDLKHCPFGILKHIRPDNDTFPQVPRQDLDQVGLIGKPLGVIGIDDQLGPFKLHFRDGDTRRYSLIDLILQFFQPIFNKHPISPKKKYYAVAAALFFGSWSSGTSKYSSFVITTTCTPSPEPASLFMAARTALTASEIASFLFIPLVNRSSSTPYAMGDPDPVATISSSLVAPPIASTENRPGPESSTPPTRSWT